MIYLNIRSLSLPPFLFLKFKSLRRHILYSHPTHNLPTYTQPAYIYTTYLHTHNLHTYTQPTYIYTTYLHTHNLPTYTQPTYIHTTYLSITHCDRFHLLAEDGIESCDILWSSTSACVGLYLPTYTYFSFFKKPMRQKKFCSQSYKCHCLAATIALWFRLCLPSCGCGFES